MRALDILLAAALLLVLAIPIIALAIAIRIDSPGPALYRSRRVGRAGREFVMLKFRKMPDGAGGCLLTSPADTRFTRLGAFLARTKLDELPQLLNVLIGDMSLVGPRPEDPKFVALRAEELEPVLRVRPGITGLSQIAFAREAEILDPENREQDYVARILPAKIQLDSMYVALRSTRLNLRVLVWTGVAVVLRRDVAVNRKSAAMGVRRRPSLQPATVEHSSVEPITLEPATQGAALETSPVRLAQGGSR